MSRPVTVLALLGLSMLVTACGGSHSDLASFVARVKARPGGAIEPIPTIAPYRPYTYRTDGRRAPFTPTVDDAGSAPRNNGPAPDLARARDPLERFPLDALHMVGTITNAGQTYALIHAPDNIIYRAKRGDHLGEHFGAIQAVSDRGVTLVEIVPNGTGGYVKQAAALAPSG